MRENNRGSIIILTVIGIATLLVAVIGATFAYFTATVRGNPTESNVLLKSETMVIEFATLNKVEYRNVIPGRPKEGSEQYGTNILKFSVSNATDAIYNQKYSVYLNIEENDFESDNVVYLLKEADVPEGSYSIQGGQYFTSDNYVNHTFEGDTTPTKLGKIPAGQTGEIKIGTAELGKLGSKDNWEFEIWVNEIGKEQNIDQDRTIKCYITIKVDDPTPETNEPNYDPSKDTTQ